MSSKKFVYLLMTVALVCGFIAADTAHGQSTGSITFKGTVQEADGTPAPGYAISGETIPANAAFNFVGNPSRTDGSYDIVAFSFAGATLSVGDQVKITATDAEGNAVSVTHTLTAADVTSGIVDPLNITVGTSLTVESSESELPADGSSTATITITVIEGGAGVTGDTVSLTVDNGTVDASATEVGNGVYSATYTAPAALPLVPVANIAVTSATTGLSRSAAIVLTPVPITVTVAVNPSSFIADTPSDGDVTVTVTQVGPVTDATVTLALNPAVGSVGAVTNDGGGTYSATYTSGGTAGNVTLTATVATGELDSTTITINAGPPAAIALSAAPMTVTSLGSSTVTAMVSDASGNPVGGLTLDSTNTGGGTVGAFTETAFGTYTATYTAPMVAMGEEGPDTITVSTDGVSDSITLDLTSEPPIPVNIITVEGTVYKEDGEIVADGAAVTVTIGTNAPEMRTAGADGGYEVTLVSPLSPVATTGDTVSIAVADANVVSLSINGMAHAGSSFPLVNDILEKVEAGMSVMVDVTTDIVIPPRTVNALVVEGNVYKEDGTTSAGGGLDVSVTVGANSQTVQTDAAGSYVADFVELLSPVATSHDIVVVVASDATGVRGTNDSEPIRNAELPEGGGAATITRDVITDIGLTSNVLVVLGTVYLKNGDTEHVPAASHLREGDLTVSVTNTTRNWMQSTTVDANGEYEATQVNPLSAVAETGDVLVVTVTNDAGTEVANVTHELTIEDLQTARVDLNILSEQPAEVRILAIEGDVVNMDGTPADGVAVSIRIDMHGTVVDAMTTTDAAGEYTWNFVDLTMPVAATGDILTVDVLRESDQFHGHAIVELRSYQLVYLNQPLVIDTITLIPPRLELGGLSINPHYTGIQDPIIQQLLGMDLGGLAAEAGALAEQTVGINPLVALPPSLPLLISPILASIGAYAIELPAGFDPDDENIAKESFGNAITTRPTAWQALSADRRHPGRWMNGDQLNLYVSGAPTIESVTFSLNGALMSATSVPEGGSFMYSFQLEEEWIALFSGAMPTFGAVQLMIDGQMPVDMARNDMGVWSADVALSPGDHVSYYYMITLSKPYVDPAGGVMITTFPFLDPRNRQVRTDGISETIESLLLSELGMISEGLRSVFSVPAVDYQQSLWVATLDIAADGVYQLDTNVTYRGTAWEQSITGKMIYVDRTAPTADVTLSLDAPGHNAGLYMRDDGVYVATGPMPGEASLTVSAIPGATIDPSAGYLYQLAALDESGYPGAWNPVIHADLLPLNLNTLLNDPVSVLPLTFGDPIDMLIRNSEGGGLLGTYGLRAVGIDSLLNMDSGRGPGVVVELVPPDPDVALVTSVQSDFDGNGAIEGLEMQYTSGDVAVFSDSLVELTVYMRERTVHPLKSIAIEFQLPGGDWHPIGAFGPEQLAGVMQGAELSVPLPVPDFPMLPDRGAHIMVRTVTTNALDVVNVEMFAAAYLRRTPPEVSAVHTYVTDRHPDSGAAQGLITVSAFTQAMTNPSTVAVQLEIRRSADTDWTPLGIIQIANSKVTSHVQIAIIEDLVNAIVSGASTAPIDPLYREWPLTVDSAMLEDTIMDDSPAASDASLDENPYVVRAVAVDTAAARYESADGVTDSFSLDNYSPTAITQVANEVEMVAPREDESYYVSGLIAEGVPDPMLTLTSRTGSHPNAFLGGLKLAVNNAAGEAVEIAETAFSAAGNHNYMATFNLASIPNGMYTFMAVAHTADGAAEERIVAMAITVEVGNFTPPENFADPTVDILAVVNTRGDTHSPSEIDTQYVTGFPAVGEEVCVTLIVPNVSAGDVDVLIGDDGMSAGAMGALTVMDPDANNNISVCLDTSGLEEGMYGLVGAVNKPNGTAHFGLPSIRVDRTAPVIAIVSPLEGHQVSSLPTVQVAYSDDTGFDPDKLDPRAIEITLTRLGSHKEVATNPEMIRAVTAAGEVLTQSGNISYTHDDPLAGGAYRIDASVTDALGNTAMAEPVEFTSTGVEAAVTITSPAGGQSYDLKQPMVVEATLAGNGAITVTEFTLNGTSVTPVVNDNQLSYAVRPTLERYFRRGYSNFVVIKIEDEEGNTAEATAQFTIALDTKPPQVVSYSPQGTVRTDKPVITVTASDESGIRTNFPRITVDGIRSGDQTFSSSGGSSTSVFTPANEVGPGTYTVTANVEDKQGNRIRFQWTFAVELDVTPPSITATSPHGVIRSESPVISVSASDDMSGVDTITISVTDSSDAAVQGTARVASDKTSATFTPGGALLSGVYTVDVQVTDMRGNTASSQWQFTIELDTIAPSILSTRPTQEHTENRRPTISATYTDNMSGVNAGSVTLWVDGTIVQPDSVSETQVVYTPAADLDFGQHTVQLKVADNAPKVNTAEQEWVFYVERMGIADARNYPNPFEDETMIAFRVSRQASISIRVYDFTGRLVAEPVTNSVYEAGLVEIDWHAETTAGDHLARGVYFCHILMESELEPQSAILKMAVISE